MPRVVSPKSDPSRKRGVVPEELFHECECQSDSWIKVCAGYVARYVDHDHYHKAKGKPYTDVGDCSTTHLIGHDRPTSGEYESKCSHHLGANLLNKLPNK